MSGFATSALGVPVLKLLLLLA